MPAFLAYMADAPAEAALCLICKTEAVTYMTLPCRHPSLCSKCAIKVATGGKCKVCNKFFQRLKKVGEPDDEEDEEEKRGGDADDDDDDDDEDDQQ